MASKKKATKTYPIVYVTRCDQRCHCNVVTAGRSKGVRSIDNEQILLNALTKLVGEENFYVCPVACRVAR